MRKLARECVIFMLLGVPVLFAVEFYSKYREAHPPPVPASLLDPNDPSSLLIPMNMPPAPNSEIFKDSLATGFIIGIPSGFALWALYRAIHFAITG